MDPASYNHKHARVNGINYHYVDEGHSDQVIVLAHGFPDLWYGWRYQIPYLVKLGYRVIVPDFRGYGQTDAPHIEPGDKEGIRTYGLKNICKDMAQLLDVAVGPNSRAIFIGHDWGAMSVWRMCLHYPERVQAVGAICVPFNPPNNEYVTPEQLVKAWPQWKYQLWFIKSTTDQELNSDIPRALACTFRGAGENTGLIAASSIDQLPTNPDRSPKMKLSEKEFEYYCKQFARTGFHGPLNWYRTRRVNFEDEQGDLARRITIPALMVLAEEDAALPPVMARNMPALVSKLTMKKLKTAHFVMMEKPNELNVIIGDWLKAIGAGASKL
ncbi:Alpha/Beta hydrolase protein [Powellomyces hirtus]|nr:Alpha/Beta hydrolase protein [Powellomyces hirtus]